MKQQNRTGIVRRAAGVAVLAVLAVGCSGSSDGAETEISTPVSELEAAPITDAPTTVAPVVTDPPETDPTLDASAIPELPCSAYVAEEGFPLKPCDSGVLVETLQRDLESLFPAIAIDGLFGSQTFDFVKQFQTSNALDATGLVSEALADQISTAEALGDGSAEADETDTEPVATEPAETAAIDPALEELCNGLIGNVEDPNFTAEQIEECSEAGIDIVGEG